VRFAICELISIVLKWLNRTLRAVLRLKLALGETDADFGGI
jgi:hypothetical protein